MSERIYPKKGDKVKILRVPSSDSDEDYEEDIKHYEKLIGRVGVIKIVAKHDINKFIITSYTIAIDKVPGWIEYYDGDFRVIKSRGKTAVR